MRGLLGQLLQHDVGAVENHHEAALPLSVGHAGAEDLAEQVDVNDGVAAFFRAVVGPSDVDVATDVPVVHGEGSRLQVRAIVTGAENGRKGKRFNGDTGQSRLN